MEKILKKNLDYTVSLIQKNGFKLTKQRKAILDIFLSSKKHLNIEEIFLQAQEKCPNINLATVYRTLSWLKKYEFAQVHYFLDNKAFFEPALVKTQHHDHLICTSCGIIIEFFNQKIEDEQQVIAKKYHFVITNHKMELYGLCKKCA